LKSVRRQMLEHVSPEVALFIATEQVRPKAEREQWRAGSLRIHEGQAEQPGAYPLEWVTRACLQLSAKESFQARSDIEMLTELLWAFNSTAISASTDVWVAEAKQPITEVSIDGARCACEISKIQRVPGDYKAVRLGGIYYGGFFQDNLALIDFVRCQPLIHPLVCLGDGHDGVWNLLKCARTRAMGNSGLVSS